ncbi:MAG: hypothetical protein F4025_09830 [Synechococcus sp. SB0669_bin_7]|nr:hypothetical protein [Synechococcus sp. SB0675_bin_7]MYK86672.1 hypothetical protein [Synechococcus sp. SB0669_bin_7]
MATPERSKLYVEGRDDSHAIGHLLHRHGIQCLIKGREGDDNATEISAKDGKGPMLDSIRTHVEMSDGRSVGFVLDADDNPQARWSAVRGRLQGFELDLPEDMPVNGYVGVTKYQARVGVWLMPDNQRAGALEEFLADLVTQGDSLLGLAECSTEKARSKGATFPDTERAKAVLHTWLAWQKDPGLPYGTAIKAQFFDHNSHRALAFVAWYGRLFPSQD